MSILQDNQNFKFFEASRVLNCTWNMVKLFYFLYYICIAALFPCVWIEEQFFDFIFQSALVV